MNTRTVSQCQAAISQAVSAFGKLDVLFCCSSEAIIGTVEELATSQRTQTLIRDQFETNFFGPVNIIKAALPAMRDKSSGHIIILTGISAHLPSPHPIPPHQLNTSPPLSSRPPRNPRPGCLLRLRLGPRRLLRQPRLRNRPLQHQNDHRPAQPRNQRPDQPHHRRASPPAVLPLAEPRPSISHHHRRLD